jgi:hypothetical protein
MGSALPDDTAFLPCQKGKLDYMMVSSGGWAGSFCLLAKRSDEVVVKDEAGAQAALERELAQLTSLGTNVSLAGFPVSRNGKTFMIEMEFEEVLAAHAPSTPQQRRASEERRLWQSKLILSEHDVAVVFRARQLAIGAPLFAQRRGMWFAIERMHSGKTAPPGGRGP